MEYVGINTIFNQPQQLQSDVGKGILAKNVSGEDIPPYAAVRITGTITDRAREVSKPNADSMDTDAIAFNGAQVVPTGTEFFASTDYENYCYLKSGDSPSIGDDLGTESGAWTLTTSQSGFKARGGSGRYHFCVPFSSRDVEYDTVVNFSPAPIDNYFLNDTDTGVTMTGRWFDIESDIDLRFYRSVINNRCLFRWRASRTTNEFWYTSFNIHIDFGISATDTILHTSTEIEDMWIAAQTGVSPGTEFSEFTFDRYVKLPSGTLGQRPDAWRMRVSNFDSRATTTAGFLYSNANIEATDRNQ